ncbi:unnamed protein product, partial [Rotaria sordida]
LAEWAKRENEAMILLKIDEKTATSAPMKNDLIQNHERVVSLIEPIEREIKKKFNLNIKLIDLRKIASDRNAYTHKIIDTIDQQKDFFNDCRNFQFSEQFKYTTTINELIKKLTEYENAKPKSLLKNFKNSGADPLFRRTGDRRRLKNKYIYTQND